MDYRYDTSKPSYQINQGLKLYRTTALSRQFFLVPGHAILSTFLEYLPKGLAGTSQNVIPTPFNRLMRPSHPPVQGTLIPSRRYVNPNAILLEEYTLTSSIIYNPIPSPPPSPPVQGLVLNKNVPYPPVARKPDGKFDVVTTAIDLENLIVAGPVSYSTIRSQQEVLNAIEIDLAVLPKFAVLDNHFAINWESVTLSYLALISQGQTPAVIRDSISQYIISMLIPAAAPVSKVPPPQTAPPATANHPVGVPSKPMASCNIVTGKAPMAQFICGQLNAGPQWEAIMKGQIKCTQKGFNIADSLIKVAATRIFAIPEQSIMEPVVNSLDAFNPARKVGKFGMGFFSLMYWIMRDPKAKLRIVSIYRRPGDQIPCAYGAEITNLNGELQVEVINAAHTVFPHSQNQFTVEVDFGTPVDAATQRKFVEQLNRLRYIKAAFINVAGTIVNADSVAILSNADRQRLPRVDITLNAHGFSVTDNASGVPIELFFSSLIVPSISSKTIALSNRKDTGFVGSSRAIMKPASQPDSSYSSFRVLVGDIVIMDLKPEEMYLQSTVHILTLPLNTRVPVSRDDVILSSVLPEVEENLEQLLVNTLTKGGNRRDVGMLENGLKAFINETASTQNVEILTQFLNSISVKLKRRGLVTVPAIPLYLNMLIGETTFGKSLVTSNVVDLRRLEEHIATNFGTVTDAFTNRQVILLIGNSALKTAIADSGDTTSYIFVDNDWAMRTGRGWASKLASEYKQVMLYPIGTAFADSLSISTQAVLARFNSQRVVAAASAMAGQYQLALNFREPTTGVTAKIYLEQKIPLILLFLKIYYEPFMREDRFEQFINLISTAVSKSDPKVAVYGTASNIETTEFRYGQINTELANKHRRHILTAFNLSQLVVGKIADTQAQIYSSVLATKLSANYSDRVKDPGFKHPQSVDLDEIVRDHRELFDKATFYLIEIYSHSIELATRFSLLGGATISPFTVTDSFNIPLDLAYIYVSRDRAVGTDLYLFNTSLSLLEQSQRAYQYFVAVVVLYTLRHRLKEDGKVSAQQAHPLKLIAGVESLTKPDEFARIILSAVDTEFGPTPQIRVGSNLLYIYLNLGLGASIFSNFQFKHLYHDFYKPALDIYGWLEKRLKVSSLVQEVDNGIPSTIPNCYSFTLSQMVSYVFQEELPPTVIQLFENISRHQSRVESRLQIIEIAVNEG